MSGLGTRGVSLLGRPRRAHTPKRPGLRWMRWAVDACQRASCTAPCHVVGSRRLPAPSGLAQRACGRGWGLGKPSPGAPVSADLRAEGTSVRVPPSYTGAHLSGSQSGMHGRKALSRTAKAQAFSTASIQRAADAAGDASAGPGERGAAVASGRRVAPARWAVCSRCSSRLTAAARNWTPISKVAPASSCARPAGVLWSGEVSVRLRSSASSSSAENPDEPVASWISPDRSPSRAEVPSRSSMPGAVGSMMCTWQATTRPSTAPILTSTLTPGEKAWTTTSPCSAACSDGRCSRASEPSPSPFPDSSRFSASASKREPLPPSR
mmetsp:Transcript_20145/g.77282  ORF Transcript_20145/g.77282 Transcript_20145/m.77282 type:complete len:323 (+) Transcript_20145:1733-2701(+)